jgi:hypothetical protein
MRRLVLSGVLLVVLVGVWLLWPRGDGPDSANVGTDEKMKTASDAGVVPVDSEALPLRPGANAVPVDLRNLERDFPIVAPLNRPDSTVARDLETLALVFDSWRSNFPREGNPVGENVDITAALSGDNPLGFVLIPRNHPAINAAGELCDRWGTPFRFHQVSGQVMEVRSAGPDRTFATADDAEWKPLP